MKECVACAEEIKDQATICRFCRTTQPLPTDTVSGNSISTEASSSNSKADCPKCGQKNVDATFCGNCGTSLLAETTELPIGQSNEENQVSLQNSEFDETEDEAASASSSGTTIGKLQDQSTSRVGSRGKRVTLALIIISVASLGLLLTQTQFSPSNSDNRIEEISMADPSPSRAIPDNCGLETAEIARIYESADVDIRGLEEASVLDIFDYPSCFESNLVDEVRSVFIARFAGLNPLDVKAWFRRNELELPVIVNEYDCGFTPGKILRTIPAAGQLRTKELTLVVGSSSGSSDCE